MVDQCSATASGPTVVSSRNETLTMKPSRLTAVIRVFPSGDREFAIYYVDIFDELTFVGNCDASSIRGVAKCLAKNHGFDAFEIQFGGLQFKLTGESD